jgi:surfactin synthase thioesterase subunit
MHSPAFQHNHGEVMKIDIINKFKNAPMYFICGTKDGNRRKTKKTYKMMEQAGNKNIEFSYFEGGHIYNENEIEKMYYWMRQFKK